MSIVVFIIVFSFIRRNLISSSSKQMTHYEQQQKNDCKTHKMWNETCEIFIFWRKIETNWNKTRTTEEENMLSYCCRRNSEHLLMPSHYVYLLWRQIIYWLWKQLHKNTRCVCVHIASSRRIEIVWEAATAIGRETPRELTQYSECVPLFILMLVVLLLLLSSWITLFLCCCCFFSLSVEMSTRVTRTKNKRPRPKIEEYIGYHTLSNIYINTRTNTKSHTHIHYHRSCIHTFIIGPLSLTQSFSFSFFNFSTLQSGPLRYRIYIYI